ncbi:zinc carboxypeptidase-like [Ostrinia nubilalis]|uniref:zinc carboxypeptidase-like n=1 Tax=Ostrinia nubilalis TaxID=29057 RepID=UPI0030824BA4
MYFRVAFLVAILAIVNCEYVSYNNYKVYKVKPETDKEVEILYDAEKEQGYLFWDEGFRRGRDVRIMVAPEKQHELVKYFSERGMTAELMLLDFERSAEVQRARPVTVTRNQNVRNYAWEFYQTLDEIYEWMDAMAEDYPNVAEVVTIGTTEENRPIKGLVIDFKKSENPVYGFIEGGLHAREWISPAMSTWIIKEFLTSTDPGVRTMAEDIVWHIFPVTNPDGYVYSFTDDRMWRKNRNKAHFTSCSQWNLPDDASNGVDLNRNFGFLWNTIGASLNPCAQTFAGASGFSEKESIAISNHINSLQQSGTVLYYLSYHSFTQLLLIPYSHVSGAGILEADNYGDLFEIGIMGMDKLTALHNTTYTVGTSADILYPVSGSGFDWAKGGAHIPLVFLFELRDLGEYGFLLPPEQIIPNNEETMDGMVEMHRVARSLGYHRSSAGSIVNSMLLLIVSVVAALRLK